MLSDEGKTKEQLMNELAELRQRVAELGVLETERMQADDALQLREEPLQSLIGNISDIISDVIAIIDADGTMRYVSPSSEKVLGYKPEEVIGRNAFDFVKPDDLPIVMDTFNQGIKIPGYVTSIEYRLRHKDGSWLTFEVMGKNLLDNPAVQGIIVIYRDITKRKRAEESLRESEQNFRNSLDSSPLGIRIVTAEGELLYANQAILGIYGYSSVEELKAMPTKQRYTPQSYAEHQERKEKRQRGEPVPSYYETSIVRKDGEVRHLVVFRKEVIWDGKTQFQTLYQDITERKQAEEREKQLQQELNFSRRLASVGELAAGVAHEINNPLTGIIGFSQRLLRKGASEEIRHDLERIYGEALRAAKVVQNLLTFARRREPRKQYSDINDILQKALELRAYELRTSNIEVVTNLTPRLPETMVDFHQIQEVFLNLILNAEQVMNEAKGKGKLSIKTQRAKDCVRISFTDDGPGIPAEHLDKLFHPFFTTRGEKGGTGLGLSVCHGIIATHDGKIYVESKLGKGATFFVELPLTTKR